MVTGSTTSGYDKTMIVLNHKAVISEGWDMLTKKADAFNKKTVGSFGGGKGTRIPDLLRVKQAL